MRTHRSKNTHFPFKLYQVDVGDLFLSNRNISAQTWLSLCVKTTQHVTGQTLNNVHW